MSVMNAWRSSRLVAARSVMTAAILIALAPAAQGQTKEEIDTLFGDYLADVIEETPAQRPNRVQPPGGNILPFLVLLNLAETRADIVKALESQRGGKQVGAPVLPGGSTSLVAKGDVPSIVGVALEHGLVTGAQVGNTITLRGNLMGVIDAAMGTVMMGAGLPEGPKSALFRRLSFSASFEPTAADGGQNAMVDDADRLAAWSARFEFMNRRQPFDALHGPAWTALFDTRGNQLAAHTLLAFELLRREVAYQEWLTGTNAAVAAASDATLEQVLRERIALFASLPVTEPTRAAARSAATSYGTYLGARQRLLDAVARAPLVSLEYINNTPRAEAGASTLRLIAEGGFFRGSLAANLSFTVFNRPAGALRVRDVQAAVQYDFRLRESLATNQPIVFSLAGQAQWLRGDLVLDDLLFPGTKGLVAVGQLKVSIPIGMTGARIPFSVTFANRTELVDERVVRGQVGMTFDVDALLAGRLTELIAQ